tara:strand:+ start:90635 stop:90796 length:162 start_codon:yes stop_codon:yes gene_type:complete
VNIVGCDWQRRTYAPFWKLLTVLAYVSSSGKMRAYFFGAVPGRDRVAAPYDEE